MDIKKFEVNITERTGRYLTIAARNEEHAEELARAYLGGEDVPEVENDDMKDLSFDIVEIIAE